MERLLKSVEISGSADALMNLMYENTIGDEKCVFFHHSLKHQELNVYKKLEK